MALQFQPAALGSRAAALIIDQFIIIGLNIIFFLFLLFVESSQQTLFYNPSSVAIALFIIILFVINWGYFFAFEFFYGGRTIGKKAMGIRVIQENGHSITLLASFIRNLLRIIDSLPSSYLLGMIMVFFHSKHKRLGDIVAGTIVVHERKAKKNKRQTAIEREIRNRGLQKTDLKIDDRSLKSFGTKDWNLIKTYARRFPELPSTERTLLTKQVANILLPKIGLQVDTTNDELENKLLILYLHLKEEWEYEL